MINKTNNISFKRAYNFPGIEENLSERNKEKLVRTFEVVDKFYPNYDVFFNADEFGKVSYQIQKSNPLIALLRPDVLANLGMNVKEAENLVNLRTFLKLAHNQLWNIPEQVMSKNIGKIDSKNSESIAAEVCSSLLDFEEMDPELPN